MMQEKLAELFGLQDQVAIVTGGSGVLGSTMAAGLASAGAKVAILARHEAQAEQAVAKCAATGSDACVLIADVLQKDQLEAARDNILQRWGKIDILVNAAGGNIPAATVGPDQSVFDMPAEAFQQVLNLNLLGTLLPSQVFGAVMAQQRRGAIVNISSMAARERAMTRVAGYGAAKAAVDNITRWLAVELGRKYGAGLRVNAIAPGFFIGEQNRRLLLNEDNSLTARGQTVIDHTPAGRFGEAEELVGALIWLCSPAAAFVNGVVVPIDGGFSAFSGV